MALAVKYSEPLAFINLDVQLGVHSVISKTDQAIGSSPFCTAVSKAVQWVYRSVTSLVTVFYALHPATRTFQAETA